MVAKTAKPPKKERVAILGAGPSALVAAYRLTQEPDWADKYDITIYQQGWRVGGKCATGRDLDKHHRVYEHGIHGFLGCYFNALTVMKDVFDELDRPKNHPLPNFEKAFHGMSGVIRYEFDEGKLKKWPIYAPPDLHELAPKKGEAPPTHGDLVALAPKLANIPQYMRGLMRLGMGRLLQAYAKTFNDPRTQGAILATQQVMPPGDDHPMVFAPDKGRFDTRLAPGAAKLNAKLLEWLAGAQAAAAAGDFLAVAAIFRGAFDHLMVIVAAGGGGAESERDRLRRMALILDFVAAILQGVVKDKIVHNGFKIIDHIDHVDWLEKHGARPETIASPLTSSTPNITYQYPKGDSLRPAVMAAGAYLHWTMMTFTYMGEFIQLFEAGSGETLIAPLHEALEKKGVKFAFFHKVTDIRANKGRKIIDEVDVEVQATVKKGPYAYKPYVKVKRLDCWPDRPLYAQLKEGEALKASGEDLESFWSGWAPAETKTLKLGEDFDTVLIGISVGALPFLTKSLAKAHRPWKRMLDGSTTVVTQAMQIWLNKTPWDLGWNGYTNIYDDYLLSANFMTQPNGQGDFTKYIKYEGWPKEHEPASLLLLCGTLPFYHEITGHEGPDFPRQIAAQVKHQSIQFLQATGGFMLENSTVAEQRGYGDPFAFDFDLFHMSDPDDAREGAERFDDQYWRVNLNPSDHYVSTPPGNTKTRLYANETGFSNLSIAGDWTDNGLNVGSMEGSVRSGILAAEAILGVPHAKTAVIGFDPTVKPTRTARKRNPRKKA